MNYHISSVGVIGAGTMGGGIAAHLANIGIPVVLLDIPTPGLSEEENTRANRNKLVEGAYKRMIKARPANIASPARERFITIGNTEDDFHLLADCDWVVEVIIEQLGPKQALMARLEETLKPGAIVSSNTSGIPINQIAAGRSDEFRARFLGTHFFNPPRYLKLLEVIPTEDTDPAVTDFMVAFGRDVLGKGVVVCKDTPNFIGNRFFAVAASYGIDKALAEGYSVSEIDNITGPLIGRPKTATFRLMDLVGLDVMGHVNQNLYDAIEHDPYRDVLISKRSADLIGTMLDNKWLGNKTGQGFYKKTTVNGNREFWTLNPATLEYEAPEKVRFDSIGAVRKIEDLGERVGKLLTFDDRAADYARDLLYYGFAYAAEVAPEIAYKLSDVDDAMRWGFGHEMGPFELWDALGVAETADKMEAAGFAVADWVKAMLAAGHDHFYTDDGVYDWDSQTAGPRLVDKNIILAVECDVVEKNASASLRDMGDGVALLEFHSKLNLIDADIIAMGRKALARLDSDFDALVIGNNEEHFSAGANLGMLGIAVMSGMWDQIDQFLLEGQRLFMDLRHAPKPVVTAPHQRVLGGGVEIAMHSWATVADHETYMGLVEVGVGIIPSWGGCKELLRRRVNPVMRTANADVLPVMQSVFEQVATAKVGESAWQDKELGYLRWDDEIAFNSDHRLAKAKALALGLAQSGAQPPEMEPIYAAGRDVYYAMKLGLKSFAWAGYATPHDLVVGDKLAYVLCGGDLSAGTWVDPWHILDLEREATLSLISTPESQARVAYMLQNGRPLRN